MGAIASKWESGKLGPQPEHGEEPIDGKRGKAALLERFGSLEDPRIERTQRPNLIAIVIIARCGAMCGG